MQFHCIPEHGRLRREDVPAAALRQLQAFDERHARVAGDTVFDWSRRDSVVAKSYVGVVQVPGLGVEILPKIDAVPGQVGDLPAGEQGLCRHNLLYMLSLAGEIPLKDRDLADLSARKCTLLDAFIYVFTQRLLAELGRGVEHAYITREDNLRVVRGKILLAQQVRRNLVHRERTYVQFDEFSPDTPVNRILRATCERLVRLPVSPEQQREYLQKFEAELITPEEVAVRQRGASNAGYHYLGCAKTFARMGEAFAQAILEIRTK